MICMITLSNNSFSFKIPVKLTITWTKHNELDNIYVYIEQQNVFFWLKI